MYIKIPDRILALARAPTEINYGEVILLSHIFALNENNKCFISNAALAELLGTSERTIKRWLQELRDKDLIDVYYEEVEGRERRIIVPKLSL